MNTVCPFDLQLVNTNVFLTYILTVKRENNTFLVFHAMMQTICFYASQITIRQHTRWQQKGSHGNMIDKCLGFVIYYNILFNNVTMQWFCCLNFLIICFNLRNVEPLWFLRHMFETYSFIVVNISYFKNMWITYVYVIHAPCML